MLRIFLDAIDKRPHAITLKITALILSSLLVSACAPKVERQFKQGCRASGLNSKTCSCIYKKIAQHYGEENIQRMISLQQLPPEGYQKVAFDASLQCAAKHQ